VADNNGRGLSEKDLSIIAGIVLGDMQGGSVMMLNQSGTLGSVDLGEKDADSIRTQPRFDGSLS
jgi:hypothetical protein